MSQPRSPAFFVFHGIFTGEGAGGEGKPAPIAKVLFDVKFNGKFYSHLTADIFRCVQLTDVNYELVGKLPFYCKEFPEAVIQYYEFAIGPQATQVSHSGPKGPSLLSENVIRAEWQVALDARPADSSDDSH